MKIYPLSIQVICIITLAIATLISHSSSLEAQTSRYILSQRPKPPATGTPSGNSTPATTRPEITCQDTDKPLTALLANNGSDFTISEYPKFWFYIPYASEEISYMEFLLLNGTERQTIYHTAVKLREQPGLIEITIPAEPQYALKVNENYRWRFNLDCEPDRRTEPDLVVNGWVRRIPLNPQLENQLEAVKPLQYSIYRDNFIWYDAIALLAELHFAEPENQEWSDAWANLLQSLDLEWVILEPFAESELLPPEL
ncbi:MAG: DUF928 domain-containing protein [Xenococcaceae cyanobacterium MO_167.B27]|nr:DUF928 domain-containing protein [Xenococcaceae cyanobacterium MO_167.B27]